MVVATGGMEYQPQEYLYGQSPRVFTQTDMENLLAETPRVFGDAAQGRHDSMRRFPGAGVPVLQPHLLR